MEVRIAVPVDDNGILDGHFGHCKYFDLITAKNGNVISEEKILPPPHEPGLLPEFLSEKGITDIIAGGMGQMAINLFNQKGVNAFVGAPLLSSKELVQGYLNKSLVLTANYCNHDDENHACAGH